MVSIMLFSLAGCKEKEPDFDISEDPNEVVVVQPQPGGDGQGDERDPNAVDTMQENEYDFHEHEENADMHTQVMLYKDYIPDLTQTKEILTDEMGFSYTDVGLNMCGGVMRTTIMYGESCNYDFQFDAPKTEDEQGILTAYMCRLIEVVDTNEFTSKGKNIVAAMVEKAIANPGTLYYATDATDGNPPLISFQAEEEYMYMFLAI